VGGSTAAGLTARWEHGSGDGWWCGPAAAGAHRWSGRTTTGAADLGDLGGLCLIWGIWAAAVGWLTGRPTRSALELVGLGSPRVRG